jgi:hypothetical protein
MNAFYAKTRCLPLAASLTCCAMISLGLTGTTQAQDGEPPAILSPVGIDRCDDGAMTINFAGDPEYDYTVFVSPDLVNWEPLGFFVEVAPGQFEYVDSEASGLSSRFYQVEVHLDPPAQNSLPPQLEQLRLELGDEAFGQWLEQNKQETGTHQGVPEETVEGMTPEEQEQFEAIEQMLEEFLNDLNEVVNPPVVLPPYIETFKVMGEEAFVELLVENQSTWNNYQGVCGPVVIEMGNLYPELYQGFLEIEEQLGDYIESVLNPPVPPPVVLPPNLEQLRLELGDEGFKQWLLSNKNQWGNYQGLSGAAIQEMQENFPEIYEEYQQTEELLGEWLEQQE